MAEGPERYQITVSRTSPRAQGLRVAGSWNSGPSGPRIGSPMILDNCNDLDEPPESGVLHHLLDREEPTDLRLWALRWSSWHRIPQPPHIWWPQMRPDLVPGGSRGSRGPARPNWVILARSLVIPPAVRWAGLTVIAGWSHVRQVGLILE